MIITDYHTSRFPTWCPGCGDFGIWGALKQSFISMNWSAKDFVMVWGIGCSGNMADFIKAYGLHSLHGRSIPNAIGIKTANHKLALVVVAGDGDCYGEGGNHLLHAARGNHDITVVVHDNQVYGLTIGQVSPTAPKGFLSKSTPQGIIEVPFSPLALSIIQGATFVAQGFAGDIPHLIQLLTTAYNHKGFSLVNVLQPCVTFNKINTYQYYREHIYKLEESYDPRNKIEALKTVLTTDKIPLGVIYTEQKTTYQESLPQLKNEPLVEKTIKKEVINKFINEFI